MAADDPLPREHASSREPRSNESRSDEPRSDEHGRAPSSGDAPHADASQEPSDAFIEATLVSEEIVSDARVGVVRTGSPFVTDPPVVKLRAGAALQMRREFEAGLWRVTAGSAVLASGLLVAFGLIALGVFPTGALLIAGLGILMSLLGLTSIYPKWALALLLAHVGIFVSTFWRSLQT